MPAVPPVPPLAIGFIPRPETSQEAWAALVPGATVVLVSDRSSRLAPPATAQQIASGARDWPDSCGKTQLAVSLATRLRESGAVDTVIWVSATGRGAVLSAFGEAAAALGLQASGDAEAVAAGLVGWLRETARPWLVVLDDLREAGAVDRLWPGGPAGRVLVTTTSAAALPGAAASPVILPVGPLSHRESLAYLMGRLADEFHQRQGAVDLVAELGDVPLAVVQASSVIATSELTCRGYLRRLTARREQAASAGASPAALTLALAVEHADLLAPGITDAQLTLASLLDGNGMPYPVFVTAGRQWSAPDATIHAGLAALEAAGLLSIDRTLNPPLIRANWVVQEAIRAATPQAAIGPVARATADALLVNWPADDKPEWLARSFRSSADSVRRAAGEALWQGGCHRLLLHAGRSLDALRAGSAAVGYWSELATVSDRLLGRDHPDTLTISGHLARAYLAAGQSAEAIAWFRWVRGDRASRLGADAPATADAARDLGRALLAAGRMVEAATVLTEAVGAYERALGTDNPQGMSVRDDLITALRSSGALSAAIAVAQRVLSDRERVLGRRHPDALATAARLAEAYLADGQAKTALTLAKRVVSDLEKTLGRRHQDTIAARAVLASACYGAGKLALAVQHYEEVRDGYLHVLGGGNRLTLAADLNLALAQHAVGRRSDAVRLLREVVQRCELHLPGGDPLTALARERLQAVTAALPLGDDLGRRAPVAFPLHPEERRAQHESRHQHEEQPGPENPQQ